MQLAHLEKVARTRLDDVLVEEGALDRAQVEEAQAEQERTGKQLGEILVTREFLQDYDLAKLVVTHYPLPFLDLPGFTTRREIMALLPEDFCRRNMVLPLDQFGDTLTLAVCEAPSMELLEDIATRTNLTPSLFVVVRRALLEALEQGSSKRTAKAAAKRATTVGAVPAAAAAPKPAPEVDEAPAESGDESDSDAPLPDLVLPRVSMALVGVAPGVPKAPPAPARPGSRTSIAARPAQTIEPPSTAATTGGLRWMDTAAATPDKAPAKPAVSSLKVTGTGSNGARPKTTAGTPVAGAPAAGTSKDGAWQSIFDDGENAVKGASNGDGKPPKK
jgi:hypothetical protein